MEDLEIVDESKDFADVRTIFSNPELADRRPVWQAMSELWLHEKLTDYDLNYISIRLADSPFSKIQLRDIFDNEVRPVIVSGQYVMNSEWYVIEANWLEDSILKQLAAVQIAQENQSLPVKILKKFGFAVRKRGREVGEGEQRVALYWQAIEKLVLAMREEGDFRNRQHNKLLQSPTPFGGE